MTRPKAILQARNPARIDLHGYTLAQAANRVDSFLYRAYAGLEFVPIHNFLARRCGGPGLRT